MCTNLTNSGGAKVAVLRRFEPVQAPSAETTGGQHPVKLGGPSLWGERLGPGDTRLGESVSQVNNKC